MVAVLDNLRSIHNVGSIFRTADALGIDKLYLCGTTPSPHPTEPWRKDHLALVKTALGAEQSVEWEYRADTLALLRELKLANYHILALETAPESQDLATYAPTSDKICLVLGNEVDGLPQSILDLADKIISIPMQGRKESLNVAVTFGIATFWLLNK